MAAPDAEVVDEERLERGMNRDDPLPSALRSAHLAQAPLQVDVVPVESEQLATAEARVGEER